VLTHGVYGHVALEQLTILEAEGADVSRVAVGHADTHLDLRYLLELIGRGASVMFDSFLDMRGHMEERAAELVLDLVAKGHERRVLLSLDVCRTHHLRFGGGGGFAYLNEVFLPRLAAAGLPDATIRVLTEENPQRWLAVP
jgi:phosphotriesterase-related protein